MLRLLINTLPLLLLISPLVVWGQQPVVISGFMTQGVTYSSDNAFYGNSDDGLSTDFTEAGLNLNYLLGDRARITGQVAYRNSNELDEHELSVDLFFLEYRPFRSDNVDTSLQLGRIKINSGLYGGVSDVAAAWPMALLPETFYANRFRSILLYTDGADLTVDTSLWGWGVKNEFIYGQISIPGTVATDTWFFGLGELGTETMDDFRAYRLDLTSPDGSLTVGGSLSKFSWHFDAYVYDVGQAESDTESSSYNLFLSKTWGNWQLDAEVSRWSYDFSRPQMTFLPTCTLYCYYFQAFLDGFAERPPTVSESGYVSLTHYLPGGLAIYGGVGRLLEDRSDPYGKSLEAHFGIPGYTNYLKEAFLGVRYDLTEAWTVAGVFKYFEGTQNLVNRANPDPGSNDKYWNALHLSLSYHF